MVEKALALSTSDQTDKPPSFLGKRRVCLATLGIPPFQVKRLEPFFDPMEGIIPSQYNAGMIPDKGEAHDLGNHDPVNWQ